MDYTSRMAALLGRFRRERNGVVADTMQYRGKAYGLNYGVSLPTIRAVARAERPDSDFARFLYRQDVRELKLAAFWIADPVQVTTARTARSKLPHTRGARPNTLVQRAASWPSVIFSAGAHSWP